MDKIRLVVLNPYDSLQNYEHRPMQEAKYFQEQGKDVEVLMLQRKVLGKGTVENTIEGIPIKHFLCKSFRMSRLLNENKVVQMFRPIIYANWFFKFVVWLRKQLRAEEKICLIAHNLEMAFAACLTNRNKKISVVFVMRELYEGQTTNKLKGKLLQKVSRWIQNRSDTLVQVVPAQRNLTQEKNREKILYIPNYPEAANYLNITHIKSDKLRINYIGSVRDAKSLKMLMDAAEGLKNIQIGIHGMGQAYEELKKLEERYENVDITGYYDYQTMTEKLFSNTDILYCAYNIEVPNWRIAYPIKLYESIEAGIPVLLCRGMAPEGFVKENDCGYIFDYNVESLRNTLISIQKDKDTLDRKRERVRRLKGMYTWDKVVREYDKAVSR